MTYNVFGGTLDLVQSVNLSTTTSTNTSTTTASTLHPEAVVRPLPTTTTSDDLDNCAEYILLPITTITVVDPVILLPVRAPWPK